MRNALLFLTFACSSVIPAHASLVYLNEHEVLDTDANVVWLSPALTLGLGPVNEYTQAGWRYPDQEAGEGPTTIFYNALSFATYDEARSYVVDFIMGGNATSNPTPDGGEIVFASASWIPGWPLNEFPQGETCCGASMSAELIRFADSSWTIYVYGGPITYWPDHDWSNTQLMFVRDYIVPVPVPGGAWLLIGGLTALGFVRRTARSAGQC